MEKRKGFGEFSPEELRFIEELGKEFEQNGFPNFVKNVVELRRTHVALCIALAQLQLNDHAAYSRIVIVARSDYQMFLDDVNEKLAASGTAEFFDVNILLADVESVARSIFFPDKYGLRAEILNRLKGNSNAADLIDVLEGMQTSMPRS